MMWGWGGGLMFFWMVVFWGGTILLIIWGVRQFTQHNRPGGSRAVEILEERYARGEIDREEFESRRHYLRG
jgi:putative membrane protein